MSCGLDRSSHRTAPVQWLAQPSLRPGRRVRHHILDVGDGRSEGRARRHQPVSGVKGGGLGHLQIAGPSFEVLALSFEFNVTERIAIQGHSTHVGEAIPRFRGVQVRGVMSTRPQST
jgi:hypothetical protein